MPTMARFVLADNALPTPDAVLLESLERRMLLTESVPEPTPLVGFDKASNSMFLPPELFSVNCWFCLDSVSGFDLSRVGSGLVETNELVTFQADGSWSECYGMTVDPETEEETYYQGYFIHDVDFDDGNTPRLFGPYGYWDHEDLQFTHSFAAPGNYNVTDDIKCYCTGSIYLDDASEPTEVCAAVDVDGYDFHDFPGRPSLLQTRYGFTVQSGNIFKFNLLPLDTTPSGDRPLFEDGADEWDTTKSMCAISYTSDITFDWRSSVTANLVVEKVTSLPGLCGKITWTGGGALEVLKVLDTCTAETAAHEYGHLLGLLDRSSGNQDPDIMRSPAGGVARDVQAYHIRRLIEEYE
jgi:hypothetical protein